MLNRRFTIQEISEMSHSVWFVSRDRNKKLEIGAVLQQSLFAVDLASYIFIFHLP